MKFGDLLTGTIDHLDEKGCGVFSFSLPQEPSQTRSVVVPFTSIGDVVEARFVKRDRGHWLARLERILTASEDRVTAPCPHAGTCGGCLWQHLSYDAQVRLKQQRLASACTKAEIPVVPQAIHPCPHPLFYRNRMDYAIGWRSEIGLKEYGSWSHYLDLSSCSLLSEAASPILAATRTLMRTHDLAPWDAKHHRGLMRYVVVREGKNTAQRLIMLVVKDASALTETVRAEAIQLLGPLCTTLVIGENALVTDLSYVQRVEPLTGTGRIQEEINGITYEIHPNAFFQTNSAMAATLQKTVLEELGPLSGKNILDLYCGLGFFGIACAKQGATIYGRELDADAIEHAKQNAERNNVAEKCAFSAGTVETFDWQTAAPDAVIIDPPRAGLHPHALKTLLEKRPPKIVYISCNYHSFLREWPEFSKEYQLERMQPLDLFPQTPHLEVVSTLVRRSS